MVKREFLNLGQQPIANGFLTEPDKDEYKFVLAAGIDTDTGLVSLMNQVPPAMMFNDSYHYHTSSSGPMRDHFKRAAIQIRRTYNPRHILEIGSNDGCFLKHWNSRVATAVEPCGNFASMTRDMGYDTHEAFWSTRFVSKNLDNKKFDVIYAANCFCHIQDIQDAMQAVNMCLKKDGVLIIEDPSLMSMVTMGSYDQIYDEHAHIFSVTALNNVAKKADMFVFDVQHLDIHGGSNRVFIAKNGSKYQKYVSAYDNVNSLLLTFKREKLLKLDTYEGLSQFSTKVEKSRKDLIKILSRYKAKGYKIISYGATSKSTVVFNYCNIGPSLIDYIIDDTPAKQGKYSPGMHIPIVSREEGMKDDVKVVFLGAWNFKSEIISKEKAAFNRGTIFVTHVPNVTTIKRKPKMVKQ
jgi:methylation protein EvaC